MKTNSYMVTDGESIYPKTEYYLSKKDADRAALYFARLNVNKKFYPVKFSHAFVCRMENGKIVNKKVTSCYD